MSGPTNGGRSDSARMVVIAGGASRVSCGTCTGAADTAGADAAASTTGIWMAGGADGDGAALGTGSGGGPRLPRLGADTVPSKTRPRASSSMPTKSMKSAPSSGVTPSGILRSLVAARASIASLRSRSAQRDSAACLAFLTWSDSIMTLRLKGSFACSMRKACVTSSRNSRTAGQKRAGTAISLLQRRSARRRSCSISYETASLTSSATRVPTWGGP